MAKKKSVRKKAAPKKAAPKKSKAKKTSGKTTRKKSVAKKKPAKKPAAKSVKGATRIRSLATTTSTLTFLTESLPAFTVGQAQKTSIQGVGGTKPYSFGITQGTLPAGLNFNYRGTLGGTPTQAGYTTIFVRLADFVGNHLTQAFEVQVLDA